MDINGDSCPSLKRREYFLLALVAVVGVGLRLIDIGKASLEIEQATWLYYALQPMGEMLKWLGMEVTGVLDVFVLHALSFFSRSPDALRLYQVALFPFTVWFMFRLSKLVFNDGRPGVFAALMFAVSPLCVHYTQVLRYHSLAMFEVVGAVMFFFDYLVAGKRLSAFLFMVFFAAAGLTHYYTLALFPALVAGSLLCVKATAQDLRRSCFPATGWKPVPLEKNLNCASGTGFQPVGTVKSLCSINTSSFNRKRAVAALACGCGSLAICAPVFISQFSRRVGSLAGSDDFFHYVFSRALFNIPDAMLQFSLGAHYLIHSDSPLARVLLFSAVGIYSAILVALISQAASWSADPLKRFFFVAVSVAVVLPFFSVPFVGMPYVAKFLLPFVPLFFLLISGVVAGIKFSPIRNAIFAALLVVMSVSLFHYYQVLGPRPSFKDAVQFLAKNARPGDTVVISPGYYFFMFDIYGPVNARLLSVPQGDFVKERLRSKDVVTPESMEMFADKNLVGIDRVWVFYGDGNGQFERVPADIENATWKWFEKRFSPIREFDFYISPIMPEIGKPLGIVRLYERKREWR